MTMMTRRQAIVTAAGAALGMSAAAKAAAEQMSAREQELYAAARKEGEVTWYSGQYNAEASEAIGRAFTERYPDIRCNVVRSTSQVAFQRLSQDTRAGTAQCDVFSSTNSGHMTLLKGRDMLLAYRPETADGLLPVLRDIDPDGFFHVTYAGLFMMAHNTARVPEAEAPKGWAAALDERWKEQLSIGHPGFSGAIGVWGVQMLKMFGKDFLTRLERNKPLIGRSSQDPVTVLNAGERTVGLCVPFGTATLSISRGNPLRMIYPEEGVLAALSPSAIPANAPHPNAARLFMTFKLGPHFSDVVRRFYNSPLRADGTPPEGLRPLSEITLLAPSLDELETGVPEVLEMWRDTFGV